MTKYDLITLRFNLKHAKTPSQVRAAIDSFPETSGMSLEKIKGILKVAESEDTGKSLEEIRQEAKLKQSFVITRKVSWR